MLILSITGVHVCVCVQLWVSVDRGHYVWKMENNNIQVLKIAPTECDRSRRSERGSSSDFDRRRRRRRRGNNTYPSELLARSILI